MSDIPRPERGGRHRTERSETAPPFRAGIFLALLCVGCTPHQAALPKEASNPHLNLALEMTPRPVTSLDPTRLTVQIRDASGKKVHGATVRVNLDMPAMPMGDNTQTLREIRVGEYGGTGRFTMAGAWRVTITAVLGSEQATQAVPIEVR